MTDHAKYAELVAGQALDALEPADERVLLDHLPLCSGCRQLSAEMRAVAAQLAYDVDDVEPPASLLAALRAAVGESGERAPDTSPAVLAPTAVTPASAPPSARAQQPSEVVDLAVARERRARRWQTRLLLGVASAAAGIALVVGGAVVVQHNGTHGAPSAEAVAEQQVLSHLDHPGAYTVTLASGGAPTGAAVVDGRDVYLVEHNLARNDSKSSIYVLWASADSGAMVPVSGFDVHGDVDIVHAQLPASVTRPQNFGVTHEAGRSIPELPGSPVLGVRSGA